MPFPEARGRNEVAICGRRAPEWPAPLALTSVALTSMAQASKVAQKVILRAPPGRAELPRADTASALHLFAALLHFVPGTREAR